MGSTRYVKYTPWQSNKTLYECNKYMLENELYCDVTFLVGDEVTGMTEIKAHRHILISRSPVFEAMLCGHLKEEGVVKIPDVDGDMFQRFLRYMYYDEFQVDSTEVLPQLYLANKYIVPALESRCEQFLEENLYRDNVCQILEHCLLYQKENIAQRCLKTIWEHAKYILEGDEFLAIEQPTLKYIVSDCETTVSEEMLFLGCLNWANNKCSQTAEPSTCEALRRVLGDVKYCIRFPTMTSQFLADDVAPTNILTKQELLDVQLFVSGSKKEIKTPFSSKKRWKVSVCNRLALTSIPWTHHGPEDAIAFESDQCIQLCGIKAYGSVDKTGSHSVELAVYQGDICLGSTECEKLTKDDENDIYLTQPIDIANGVRYHVVLKMRGSETLRGNGGHKFVSSDGVNFKFYKSYQSKNGTNVEIGQIPSLIYRKI